MKASHLLNDLFIFASHPINYGRESMTDNHPIRQDSSQKVKGSVVNTNDVFTINNGSYAT